MAVVVMAVVVVVPLIVMIVVPITIIIVAIPIVTAMCTCNLLQVLLVEVNGLSLIFVLIFVFVVGFAKKIFHVFCLSFCLCLILQRFCSSREAFFVFSRWLQYSQDRVVLVGYVSQQGCEIAYYEYVKCIRVFM